MFVSATYRMPGTGVRSLVREIAPAAGPRTPGRTWLARILALAAAGAFAFLAIAHGGQFAHAVGRALHANWHLVALAVALEAGSAAGYVMLLHRVVARANPRLRLKDSYDMTLGGAAATRLLPTAGLGGAAVTVWALRARGVRARELAERLLAFLLLLYGVYLSALFAGGTAVGLGLGHVTHGRALGALGAGLAAALAVTVLLPVAAPTSVAAALTRFGRRSPRLRSAFRWLVSQLPVLCASLRRACHELRRPHPALLGAVAYWAFDLGVLATMLHAFGVNLAPAQIVLAYFLGTLFNLVPLPGSLSGGLAGALIALGSPTGAAIAAVLAYRALAVWLPAVPGIASLASLRRSVSSWRMDTASRTPSGQFAV